MKILLILTFAGTACLADSERKVKMEDLPAAVQAAVKEQSKGATIRGLATEVENGKTSYEAEMKVNGRSKDMSFDAAGKIIAVEEETTIDRIPEPARQAIQQAAGRGRIVKVEAVTERAKTFYEGQFKTGQNSREIKVDASGNRVK